MTARKAAPIPATQAHLARLAGVERQKVQWQATRGKLKPAVYGPPARRRIDLRHPAVATWLKAHGVDVDGLPELRAAATKTIKAARARAVDGPAAVPLNDPAAVDAVLGLTIEQVCERHGSEDAFSAWLDRRRKVADIRRVELANAQQEGRVIEREYVAMHVFSALDAMQRRLLTDAAKTIARRVYQMCEAGRPVEDAERAVQELLASFLRPIKASSARVLRGKPS